MIKQSLSFEALDEMTQDLTPVIERTARKHLDNIKELFWGAGLTWPGQPGEELICYLAGSCFNQYWNDLDIFLTSLPFIPEHLLWGNSTNPTVNWRGYKVQFTETPALTLKQLVDQFDFSHISVGVGFTLSRDWDWEGKISSFYTLDDVYFTREFIRSRLFGGSEYVPQANPLRSISRLLKYHRRGDLDDIQATKAMMNIQMHLMRHGDSGLFSKYETPLDHIDWTDYQWHEFNERICAAQGGFPVEVTQSEEQLELEWE